MIRRILVPLDGSPEAEAALPYVVTIARGLRAEVTLLHAIGGSRLILGRVLGQSKQQAYLKRLQAESQNAAQSYLESQADRLEGLDIPVEIAVKHGHPSEVILSFAEQLTPDLIAVSTLGRSGRGKFSMGSVVAHLVNNARSPLLLARGEGAASPASLGRVVVPLDTSELAESALPMAGELATGLRLTMTLIVALPTISQLYLGTELVAHPEEILRRSEDEAGDYLEGLCGRLRDEGTAVEPKVLHGDPAGAIVDFAARSPDTIIAMATHGRTGLGRWVLGSVTDKVIRAGECPVLVVRPNS